MFGVCKYSEQAGCHSCSVTVFKTCKKFRHYHTHFLVSDLLPVKFNKSIETDKKVVYTQINKDAVKSMAIKYALRNNLKVRKLYTNQVIDIVKAETFELTSKVYYLEIERKSYVEPDKIIGVVESFIDRASLQGAFVAVVSAYPLSVRPEWLKVQ